MLKWSVKDYFFKAGICHLATTVCFGPTRGFAPPTSLLTMWKDLVGANRALESYKEIDPTFASTREYLLLADLIQAIEHGDQDAFADKLYQFDQLSTLDKWKTTLFLRIKNNIEAQEEDFS